MNCPKGQEKPPWGVPPGEGIGEGKNFHLLFLLSVRKRTPREGCPYGFSCGSGNMVLCSL